jgi:hypothetical protein
LCNHSQICIQKQNLGLSNDSWCDFISRFREAIVSETLFIDDTDENVLELSAYCFANGKQVTYAFKLSPSPKPSQQISKLVFDMMKRMQTNEKLRKENQLLKLQLEAAQVQKLSIAHWMAGIIIYTKPFSTECTGRIQIIYV